MLHSLCKHGALQNHKTNKHEKGLKFQTEPNPGQRASHWTKKKKRKIHTTHTPPLLPILKQENVNMVIFSTCFKTDRFSQVGRRRAREKKRERQTEEKRGKKIGPHTIEGLPRFVCVFQSVRCGEALASSVCEGSGPVLTASHQTGLSHCESGESKTT